MMTEIAAGDYAVATARVENYDFATPWYQFFNSLLQDNRVPDGAQNPASSAILMTAMQTATGISKCISR